MNFLYSIMGVAIGGIFLYLLGLVYSNPHLIFNGIILVCIAAWALFVYTVLK